MWLFYFPYCLQSTLPKMFLYALLIHTHANNLYMNQDDEKLQILERLGGSAVERLPSAQGIIPDPGNESHIGLPAWSLLLLLPVSLSLSVSLMNK